MSTPGVGHNLPPPASGPFAIYRTAKLKTLAQITASAEHMLRTRPTPNADPSRAHLNRIVIGSPDPFADVAARLPEPGARNARGQILRRSNSVLAIEVLLTTSPEWWQTATPAQVEDWMQRSADWLRETYGAENVVQLRLHADERTPHLTGYVVPIDPESGTLNARGFIGGAGKLSYQQTAYADAVAHLGLQRGVMGSTAEHEAVRRVYGALSQPSATLQVPVPPRVHWDPAAWAEEAGRQMTEDLAPVAARAAFADAERTKRKAAEAQATKDRERAARAEKGLDEAKAVAARLRALPLPDVLAALGFERDPKDPAKWRHADGGLIGVGEGQKAGKWFDFRADKGRGGAIDLVCHVMEIDFAPALAWLSDRFGAGAATADLTARRHAEAMAEVRKAVAEHPPFTPPAPEPSAWPEVRRIMIEERAIPARTLDTLHERGVAYADARRNLIVLQRDEANRITGAEVKGTYRQADGSHFSGLAPGTKRDGGVFRVATKAAARAVYLVESALDAISLWTLRREAGEDEFAVVSTGGTRSRIPDVIERIFPKARRLMRLCAYDADEPGDKAARSLQALGWSRLRPSMHDWNDELVAKRQRDEQDGTSRIEMRPEAATVPPESPSP